jgi:hypothetical protein
MALDARLRELNSRHRDLDEAIRAQTKLPAHDPLEVNELKRQKLKLKEEIETLRQRLRN